MFEFDAVTIALALALAALLFAIMWSADVPPSVTVLTPLAVAAILIFGTGYLDHQRSQEVTHLQDQVAAKYRVEFYPGSGVLRADFESVDVIGFVDGEQRGCTLRFKSKTEPLVFCGAGVEADRTS